MKRKSVYVTAACLAVVLTAGVIYAAAQGDSGSAPIAENLELKTYRQVSVGGQLKAVDPDGGTLTYKITTDPTKGSIELKKDGSFVYTPDEGKKGRDYFGYKATDADGNSSSEATVIIRIEKQKTTISYSDMSGSAAHYAAVALAENDIFVGECLGGQYVFNPHVPVTRSEFLTMCLKLNDFDILSGVITTGFADDSSIPDFQKPYISTALLTGIVSGYSDGMNTAVFNGDNSISYSEAAVMLNKSMNLTDVPAENYGNTAPVWAAQSCANLSACRISDYTTSTSEAKLTRADCAKLLSEAMRVLESR